MLFQAAVFSSMRSQHLKISFFRRVYSKKAGAHKAILRKEQAIRLVKEAIESLIHTEHTERTKEGWVTVEHVATKLDAIGGWHNNDIGIYGTGAKLTSFLKNIDGGKIFELLKNASDGRLHVRIAPSEVERALRPRDLYVHPSVETANDDWGDFEYDWDDWSNWDASSLPDVPFPTPGSEVPVSVPAEVPLQTLPIEVPEPPKPEPPSELPELPDFPGFVK